MRRWICACLAAGTLLCLVACASGAGKNADNDDTKSPLEGEAMTQESEMQSIPDAWICFPSLDLSMEIPGDMTCEPYDGADYNKVFEGNSESLDILLYRWDQVSLPNIAALSELITKNTGQSVETVNCGGRELIKVNWPHGELNYYLLSEDGDAYVLWITPYVMRDPDVYWKVKRVEESLGNLQHIPEGEASMRLDGIAVREPDYFVLIDKNHGLPEGWEENLDLVSVVNSVGDTVRVERAAYKAYLELKDDLMKNEGIDLDLDSAYRSVAYQQEIMDKFTEKYGAAYAKKTVATPGFSEHHTGLALDLYFRLDGEEFYENEDLVQHPEVWKKIHARLADHGFFLRYPGRKDGTVDYTYEPWHIRYIGKEAATELMEDLSVSFEDWLAARGQEE